MDSQIDLEALRSKLREMSWAEAMRLAEKAGVSRSTATKFRMNRIRELGGFKVQRLHNALLEVAQPQKPTRKTARKALTVS